MMGLLTTARNDVKALRESWGTARGGWRVARQDAKALIAHRRVLVDTSGATPEGVKPVLRTQLRLDGQIQTDILRGWLNATPPPAIEAARVAHFASVDAAMGGFAAAVAIERLAIRLAVLIGIVTALAGTACNLAHAGPGRWLNAILMHWSLWSGAAVTLVGVLLRLALRWWLRRRFRQGLTGFRHA